MLSLGLSSCRKQVEYPLEPQIEFKSFDKIDDGTGIDNKAFLAINFTDGDGDLGLKDEDTLYPYNPEGDFYYNMLIEYYEKKADSFVLVTLPSTFNARFPYVESNYINRGISGEIQIELFYNNPLSTADSIKFSVQIIDRALNKSNVVFSPSIFVKKTNSKQ
jgi:hypothetical protein